MDLTPLPTQPASTPWPTEQWPTKLSLPDASARLIGDVFADETTFGTTYAVVVIDRGVLVAERYANALPSFTGPEKPVGPETPLLSWSMAKSITHAAVGILVGRGDLALDASAPVAAWAHDERSAITLNDLLTMRDGLDFVEDYVDGGVSDVIEMLFGSGGDDVAGYATQRPRSHAPDTVFNYSSGTSNIVARIVGDVVGGGADGARRFLRERVFDPIGMASADPRFDAAGTFVGSSYVYATARDFAKFGLLYLRDGVWDDTRLLPVGWVDHARKPRSVDAESGRRYGAHWWVVNDAHGTFWASGYEGQILACVPDRDLIIVRLGRTDAALGPNLYRWRAELTEAMS